MVRWYDYVVAVLFADLIIMFAGASVIAAPTNMLYTLLFTAMIWLIYDLWVNTYCLFRLYMEIKR